MKGKIFTAVAGKLGKVGVRVAKHSPEMLLILGAGGMVATVVLACKKTLKAEEILDRHEADMAVVKESEEERKEEGKEDKNAKRKETFIVYGHTMTDMVKLYAPVAAVGALSLASIFTGYGILKKRHLALVAAYNAVSGAYKGYRQQVIEELGDEMDKKFVAKAAGKALTREVSKEEGKETELEIVPENEHSIYAKFFDSSSRHWEKDPSFNYRFLKSQMEYANNLLHSRGHVFLNEVYDMLDIQRTPAGAVVGWVDGNGDGFIDFGIYDQDNWSTRRFVNGYENVVLLDFNVDGVIYDLI